LILLTGAAGKTGRAVMRHLAGRGCAVRAWVRSPAQVDPLKRLGATEVVIADLRDPRAALGAVRGVEAIYGICPNMSVDEEAIGGSLIAAARSVDARLVYHSVLLPRVEAMPHHWRKAQVEDALEASGIAWTVLQPAAYMQNLLQHRESIAESGVLPVPYSESAEVAMVDLEDVAVVAGRVLIESGHEGEKYELCASEIMNPKGIARVLSTYLGSRVVVREIPRGHWRESARRSGVSEQAIEDLISMFEYYERHGLAGSPDDLERLLTRPPGTLSDFLARELPTGP